MADSDVIGGIENLTDAVSGETPSYEYKNPNTDMMKAISKCIDAAIGKTGTEYEYDNPNTDVIQKMEELATAIASSGGGGTSVEKTYLSKIDQSQGGAWISTNVDVSNIDMFIFEPVDSTTIEKQVILAKSDIAVYSGGSDVYTFVYKQHDRDLNVRIYNNILYVSYGSIGLQRYATNVYSINLTDYI